MQSKPKILIDTDIGDNLDDAFAIFAAMSLNFEIVGITTVFRDTDRRARMAKKLLNAFGQGYEQVPVYAGFSFYHHSDTKNTACTGCFETDLMLHTYAPANTKPEDAIDFIIDCCHRYGKDLTVVALGPFSNIAKVIEANPSALDQAGRVVIMGGAYFMQYADWNVMCDVAAADLMFRTLRNLECIGADVTHQLADNGNLERMLCSPLPANGALPYIKDLYRRWKHENPGKPIVLHDALVIYYLQDPQICKMKKIHVAVICEGLAQGITLNTDSYGKKYLNPAYQDYALGGSVRAAFCVDADKFHTYILRDISACILSDTPS